ncbi:hypothetical protein THRCLA_10741 [Thraustotheca clavata]|uniref:Transmembrane protein n=1 Tax=Thraustotheca clavata TaxID=74557 RepID=A0A1V9YHI8_9STRA|nr:hypothetical protein THRCLA_10741 [Thraustotheca clavata]
MVKDTARQSWGYDEFVYDAVIRSDLQVFFLSFFHLLAHMLHLRVHLIVIIAIYYGCYMSQDKINSTLNLCQSASSSWLYENYMLNTIMATGGMDLWAFHENYETSWAVMAAELAWYILAWCLACAYILVVACYTIVFYKDPNKMVAPEPSLNGFHVLGLESGLDYSHFIHRIINFVLCRKVSRRGPQLIAVRPHQVDPRRTIFFNVEATNFEKSVRRRYFRTHGFIAPLSERVLHDNQVFATHSLIWLLGFVIVRNEYLVCIGDVPYLWINCLLRRDIYYVYGYPLTKEKDTIESNAVRIPCQDYSLSDLFSITIRPLR